MRGSKARELRKAIYGAGATRTDHRANWRMLPHDGPVLRDKDGRIMRDKDGAPLRGVSRATHVSTGARRAYRQAKKLEEGNG